MFTAKWLYFNFQEMNDSLKFYVLAYLTISGILSVFIVYSYGPLTNKRYINIVEWLVKIASCIIILISVTNMDIFVSFIFVFLNYKLIYKTVIIFKQTRVRQVVPRKFKSQHEYSTEADEFTRKQLEELKSYCIKKYCCLNCDELIISLNFKKRYKHYLN